MKVKKKLITSSLGLRLEYSLRKMLSYLNVHASQLPAFPFLPFCLQKVDKGRGFHQERINLQKGFTLVELLAVTAILVIVSGMIAGILYSTLRGSNKIKVTSDVSQNGNYALSVMSNTILSSESVSKIDGSTITDCTANPSGKSIELKQSDGGYIEFQCTDTDSIASISGQTTSDLIDTKAVMIPKADCSFTCIQTNNDPYALPIINVAFTVTQLSTSSNPEGSSAAQFNTSITMRNFNPK